MKNNPCRNVKVNLKNFVRRWDERGFGSWCITEKKTGEVAGYCGFQYFDNMPQVEIVFAFLKKFWEADLQPKRQKPV